MVRNDTKLTITFTAEAKTMKADALALADAVEQVTTPEENQIAVQAQTALQTAISLTEKSRKACKEPVLEYGRKIDEAAKIFIEHLKTAITRVSQMTGDFAALEQAKVRAAEQARNQELLQIERDRATAMAQAQTHEQLDEVAEHFSAIAAAVAPPPEPVRAEGQRITNDWDVVVQDVHLLYRCHSNCVKLEPLMGEIKNLLKMGVTPKGVIATPIVKAGVRAGRYPTAIDV